MPVNTQHVKFEARLAAWERVRDALEGEDRVKAKNTQYLPRPPGMDRTGRGVTDGNGKPVGDDRYSFYLGFAEFPEIVGPTLDGIQGLIHEKPADVKLPKQLEYLIEDATPDGEPLATLWERMTREVSATGRVHLLHDVGRDDVLRFCTYPAEAMINWLLKPKREGAAPTLVVLRETQSELIEEDGFAVKDVTYYRELRLVDGIYRIRLWVHKESAKPTIVPLPKTDAEGWMIPVHFGRNFLKIPIDVINAAGEGFDYGPIPIMPMVKRAYNIYRKTADYNRSLYVKTDPQPVIYGVDDDDVPESIGGDSIWHFSNPEARAELLDIDGLGIPLLRQAIEDEYQRFQEEGGRLRESDGGPESGEAVKRRQMVKQVTTKSLVINAGAQFEEALRGLARSRGLGEDAVEKVEFKPNLDFAEPPMDPQDFDKLVDSKLKGGPLSWRSIHRLAKLRKLTDREYEEELDEIEEERMDEIQRNPVTPIDDEPEDEPDDEEGDDETT